MVPQILAWTLRGNETMLVASPVRAVRHSVHAQPTDRPIGVGGDHRKDLGTHFRVVVDFEIHLDAQRVYYPELPSGQNGRMLGTRGEGDVAIDPLFSIIVEQVVFVAR